MDGFSREKIISNGLINPSDLTLDKVKNILYWVDGGEKVHYISLETRKRNVSGNEMVSSVIWISMH
jgi:hypothetical protein